MENHITEDTGQIPVWTVQGKNWYCNVALDLFNSQFSSVMQAEEASTRAIEQFQGQDRGLTLVVADGEKAEVGGVILAFLLNTKPDDGFLFMVHEILANAAYYKDSIEVEKKTREILEKSMEAEQSIINAEVKALDDKYKPPKKPRKKTPKKPASKPKKSPKKKS